MKVPQNCFNSLNCSNQAGIKKSKFLSAIDNLRTDLKFLQNLEMEF